MPCLQENFQIFLAIPFPYTHTCTNHGAQQCQDARITYSQLPKPRLKQFHFVKRLNVSELVIYAPAEKALKKYTTL